MRSPSRRIPRTLVGIDAEGDHARASEPSAFGLANRNDFIGPGSSYMGNAHVDNGVPTTRQYERSAIRIYFGQNPNIRESSDHSVS